MKNKKLFNILARIWSFILNLIAPSKCAVCSDLLEESGELCPTCLKYFTNAMNRRCPLCLKTPRSCTCRPKNLFETTEIGSKKLLALTFFAKPDSTDKGDIVTRKIVYNVKKSYVRSSSRFVARQLSHETLKLLATNKYSIEDWYVTYPPRSKKEARKYGFDQSKELAMLISEFTGMRVINCFNRKHSKMQKNLSAAERKLNADSTYSLKDGLDIAGKKFFIIDDVITTGSTLNACASLLISGGATDVFPVSISRSKKKKRFPKRNPLTKIWFKKK